MECPSCALPIEPGQKTCEACGAVIADEEGWTAEGDDSSLEAEPATDAEPPTEVIPGVRQARPVGAAGVHPAPEAPTAAHEPPRVRPTLAWRQLALGAVVGGVVVLALLVGAFAAGGGFAGLFAAPGSPATSNVTAQPTAGAPTQLAPGNEIEGISCEPRQLAAPAAGRWRLYRVEWGSRGAVDYLRLKLRNEGQHEQAATVSVELVAPADVSGRFGIEAPSEGDIALVVAFNDPVGIGGPWGGRAGYGALREFRIARGQEGRVHAVVGARGQGCFRLSGGGWETGDMNSQTDITLEIQKP